MPTPEADKRLEQELALGESDLPAALKIVLFRIIESSLKYLALNADTDQIHLDLRLANQVIVLSIEESPQDSTYAAAGTQAPDADLQAQFAEAR